MNREGQLTSGRQPWLRGLGQTAASRKPTASAGPNGTCARRSCVVANVMIACPMTMIANVPMPHVSDSAVAWPSPNPPRPASRTSPKPAPRKRQQAPKMNAAQTAATTLTTKPRTSREADAAIASRIRTVSAAVRVSGVGMRWIRASHVAAAASATAQTNRAGSHHQEAARHAATAAHPPEIAPTAAISTVKRCAGALAGPSCRRPRLTSNGAAAAPARAAKPAMNQVITTGVRLPPRSKAVAASVRHRQLAGNPSPEGLPRGAAAGLSFFPRRAEPTANLGAQMGRTLSAPTALVCGLMLVLTACTSSSGLPSPTSSNPGQPSTSGTSPAPSTSAPDPKTSSSSTTSPAAVTAAERAYTAYLADTYAAERSPGRNHAAQLKAHAVDPALGTIEALLTKLQLAGIANRGTPPRPRVRVTKQDLGAHPWPVVTLVDCPTVSPSWVAYDVTTGKPVKVVPNPVKPPYAITAMVIKYKGRWMVSETTVDRKHTCTP